MYVWKAAVEKAQSFDVTKVTAAVLDLEFDPPGGSKRMHRTNHHTYKPVYVGRVRADGQFDIIWRSQELLEPQAFSPYLRAASVTNRGSTDWMVSKGREREGSGAGHP